jgi:hypothetical protein
VYARIDVDVFSFSCFVPITERNDSTFGIYDINDGLFKVQRDDVVL